MATESYVHGRRLLKLLRTDYHFVASGNAVCIVVASDFLSLECPSSGPGVFYSDWWGHSTDPHFTVGCRTGYHNRDALYASIIDTCTGCGWDAPPRKCGIFENDDHPLSVPYAVLGCLNYSNWLSWLLLSASSITINRWRHRLCFESRSFFRGV